MPTSTEPNPFKYSREFILSLFDPTLGAPADYDPTGPNSVAVAGEVLEPMANLPLTDHEKKLTVMHPRGGLRMGEKTKKGEYGRHVLQECRIAVIPVALNESDTPPRRRGMTHTDGDYEDPWDTPGSVGSFSGNGTFSTPDEDKNAMGADKSPAMLLGNASGRESPTPARTASPVSIAEERNAHTSSPKPFGTSVPMQTPGRQGSLAVGEGGTYGSVTAATGTAFGGISGPPKSSFADIFNPFASTTIAGSIVTGGSAVKQEAGSFASLAGAGGRHTPDPIGAPSNLRSSGSKGDLHQPHPDHISIPPPGMAPPPFVPPKWLYKDPAGNVQGPFAHSQMHEWHKLGYFSDDLPVKRSDSFNYEPLARLIQKHGRDRPFLNDLEELERLAQAQTEQKRMAPTTPGFRDLYTPDTSAASLGFSPFGGFGTPGVSSSSSLFNPSTLGGDVFGAIPGAEIGPGFGGPMDNLGSGYGRSGWGEGHGLGRTGWSTDSSFGRGGAVPASPSTPTMQSQYFDQRIAQPIPQQQSYMGGIMGQQPQSPFPTYARDSQVQSQQSVTSNLFTAQPLFDSFGGVQPTTPTSQARQQDWVPYSGLTNINTTLAASATHFPDDGQGHIDEVVSKLIEDSSPLHEFPPDDQFSGTGQAAQLQEATDLLNKTSLDDAAAEKDAGAVPVAVKKPAEGKQKQSTPMAPEVEKRDTKKGRKDERVDEKRKEQPAKDKKAQPPQVATLPTSVHGPAQSPTSSSAPTSTPAVDLRSIMSEEESRSKKEKEQKLLAKAKELEREVEELQRQKSRSTASAWAAPTSGTQGSVKLSLKEIQEIEQREREERDRERQRRAHQTMLLQAQQLQEQEAGAGAMNWSRGDSAPGVWGSAPKPAPSRSKTLSEIMQEEESRKRRDVERNAQAVDAAVPLGAGKRYADSVSVPSGSAWGAPNVRAPALSKAPAVVASGPILRSASAVAQDTAEAKGPWNVVGSKGQVVGQVGGPRSTQTATRPSAPVTAARPTPTPIRSVTTPATAPVTNVDGTRGPSESFLQWCRSALRPLERSTTSGVNVDDFITILLSFPAADTGTLQLVCDDTLGGLTAIDPRKFADEFARRRRADANGSSEGWSGVASGGATTTAGAALEGFDTGNKFVVVKQGKKKRSKKI
ncbi:hypothetical protein HK104_002957 [Borealophlyctis nickersoniae]|nr:hypothetical protein HK104_002957 [Borealophlyctis nickersoniae]